eukprot:3446721-Prymnesium_polylepis.1
MHATHCTLFGAHSPATDPHSVSCCACASPNNPSPTSVTSRCSSPYVIHSNPAVGTSAAKDGATLAGACAAFERTPRQGSAACSVSVRWNVAKSVCPKHG